MSAKTPGRAALALSAALALAVVPTTGAFATAPTTPHAVAFIGTHGYPTVQAALDASHDGDTVTVSPGNFPGGIRITHSVTLRGAGAGRTVFRGGEHVITVGTTDVSPGTEPHVTIAGVTVTGGFARTDAWPGDAAAEGAGIYAVHDALGQGGALTVTDSVVTGNRAEPRDLYVRGPLESDLSQVDWGFPICPDHQYCPAALAQGAGIMSYGALTVTRSSVTNNSAAGALSSDARGGGVAVGNDAPLTVTDSHIDGNTAVAVVPYGRFAEGGGIFTGDDSPITLTRSTVSGNTAKLSTTFPLSYPDYPEEYQPVYTGTLANAAGVHAGYGASVEVRGSHVDGNRLVYDGPNGGGGGINSGIQVNGGPIFSLIDSTVDRNTADVRLLDATDSGIWGGALQWDVNGVISHSSVSRNTSTVTAVQGLAWVSAAAADLQIADEFPTGSTTISDSVFADNRATVISPHGGGVIVGVGLLSDSPDMKIARTKITGNVGLAKVADPGTTVLRGGGINNGADPLFAGYGDVTAKLALSDSTVTGNSLSATVRGAEVTGAGIHSLSPVTLTRSTVRGNAPDDCDACAGVAPGHGGPHPSPWPHHQRKWVDRETPPVPGRH
jgi:hypothetical protein